MQSTCTLHILIICRKPQPLLLISLIAGGEIGIWTLPLDELTRSSFYSVAGSFLNIMDRVEYEVYDTGNEVYDDVFENDMDLTQDDTEASKEKVKSIKLIIK